LKRRAAGLPIEFLGFVPSQDFFGGVDILIVPSWEEPFGLVVLEAMAAGIPVIATNRGGPAEFARGVLIAPRDPAALAQAIRSIRPGDLIKDAREHVEQNFDLKKVVPRIAKFYRELEL
jgi:glycosyltransferase involved in cell wall biosynthesis